MAKKHNKLCQCDQCAKQRFEAWKMKVAHMTDPARPPTVDATVPVRAHFRKQRGHLGKDEAVLQQVQGFIKDLLKEFAKFDSKKPEAPKLRRVK